MEHWLTQWSRCEHKLFFFFFLLFPPLVSFQLSCPAGEKMQSSLGDPLKAGSGDQSSSSTYLSFSSLLIHFSGLLGGGGSWQLFLIKDPLEAPVACPANLFTPPVRFMPPVRLVYLLNGTYFFRARGEIEQADGSKGPTGFLFQQAAIYTLIFLSYMVFFVTGDTWCRESER